MTGKVKFITESPKKSSTEWGPLGVRQNLFFVQHNVPIWMCKTGSQICKGGILRVSKDGFKLQVSHFVMFLGFVDINIYKTCGFVRFPILQGKQVNGCLGIILNILGSQSRPGFLHTTSSTKQTFVLLRVLAVPSSFSAQMYADARFSIMQRPWVLRIPDVHQEWKGWAPTFLQRKQIGYISSMKKSWALGK